LAGVVWYPYAGFIPWPTTGPCVTGRKVIYSRTPLIRKLDIRIANYPDRLGPSGKYVENSIELICLEIAGYGIRYSTVLWLPELQIRRGRKV